MAIYITVVSFDKISTYVSSYSFLHLIDLMSVPSQSPPLKEIGTAVGRHLHSTIYKSEPGVLVNVKNRGGNREMISVAIRIQAKHETHHVKVS